MRRGFPVQLECSNQAKVRRTGVHLPLCPICTPESLIVPAQRRYYNLLLSPYAKVEVELDLRLARLQPDSPHGPPAGPGIQSLHDPRSPGDDGNAARQIKVPGSAPDTAR